MHYLATGMRVITTCGDQIPIETEIGCSNQKMVRLNTLERLAGFSNSNRL